MGDLSDLFGIEQDDTIKKPAKKRAVKKQVTQKKTQSRVKSSVKKVLRKTVKKTVKQKNIRPTGKTILRLRTRFGMSLAQFAQLLSVSSTTISNWEKKSEQLNLKTDKKKKLLAIIDLTRDQAWKKLK
jgi:DNA-binding transcriptional regulator YiaG